MTVLCVSRATLNSSSPGACPRLDLDDRVTQYAAASRFIIAVSGMLDRPVEPGDDSCASPHAATED